MNLRRQTIAAAFDAYHEKYNERGAWGVPHHVEMWCHAKAAFEDGDKDEFSQLYWKLRGGWQIARGRRKVKGEEGTYRLLMGVRDGLKKKRLSSLEDTDIADLIDAVRRVKSFKQTSSGLSIMAVSKLLHFLNPRLFVITDNAVILNFVLGHLWLDLDREYTTREMERAVGQSRLKGFGMVASEVVREYLVTLFWASRILKRNPAICTLFAQHIEKHKDDKCPPRRIGEYEAAAFEWFICGLVHVPPSGIKVG